MCVLSVSVSAKCHLRCVEFNENICVLCVCVCARLLRRRDLRGLLFHVLIVVSAHIVIFLST